MSWLGVYVIIGWMIRIAMVPVILRRQFAPGAALAWLGIVFLHPYIGFTLYMTVGETRLGPNRVRRHRELVSHFRSVMRPDDPLTHARSLELPAAYEPMVLQAEKISGLPVLGGNSAEFLTESGTMVDRLIGDIDAATSHAHLLYYMFTPDATGTRVADALKRAAGRGVVCRVLVDAVASRSFFHRSGPAGSLEKAGVKVAAALPVAPLRRMMSRMDLRNHRKLAVIDDRVACAGSHNLVNPDYGGRHGGPWIDATARCTGPIVRELAIVFAEDWAFETGERIEVRAPDPVPLSHGTPMQVVPTGPTSSSESFRRVFLGAIQSARQRVIMTTPYFVPDEPTLVALMMAADRGVEVNLLLPKVPDHFFTAAAGRAQFSRLMEAGVRIFLFNPGLLHTKSTTVDDAFAVFGSANLDVRSFNLNFELSLLLYGREVTDRLRRIQLDYLAHSCPVDPAQWATRSRLKQYGDRAISLLSPLL